MTITYCLQIVIGVMSISTVETIGQSLLNSVATPDQDIMHVTFLEAKWTTPTGQVICVSQHDAPLSNLTLGFVQLSSSRQHTRIRLVQRLWCGWRTTQSSCRLKSDEAGTDRVNRHWPEPTTSLLADKHTLSLLLIILVPVTSPTITFMSF